MAFTPPVSPDPFITEESDGHAMSLECHGEAERKSSFSYQGLVRCGEAVLITKSQFSLSRRNRSNIKLFGLPYDMDSQSCSDLERLFCLARKRLCNLAAAPKSFGGIRPQLGFSEALSDNDCSLFRKELRDFYSSIRCFVASQDSDSLWLLHEMSDSIKNGLGLLRLELGWLTDLPRYVQEYASSSKSSAAYHLFHAHLELRWFDITVLYYLCSLMSEGDFVDFSQSFVRRPDALSNQSAEIVKDAVLITIVDLTSMAVERFNWASCEELVNKSLYNCLCVKELWLLLVILIGKIHQGSNNKHPLWFVMDDVFELVSSVEEQPSKEISRRTSLQIPKKIKCQNSSLFSLWLLSNLTELLLYDGRGNLCRNKVEGSECNYLALKRALTQLTEESHQRTEEERRVVVHLVRSILDVYDEPKPDAIMILFDFFLRSIDLPFQLPGARAGSFAVISDTPSGLLHAIVKLLGKEPSVKTNTSYDAFLHLLGNHLERNPLHWKQKMRGRVFSKLSARKVSTLSELGLFHLIQFFITVCVNTDLEDTALKLNELLLSVDESDIKRHTLTALARLALVQLMASKNVPMGKVLEPSVSDVSRLVRHGDLRIPRIFVDAVEDIMKCNESLDLDQHLIVGEWIHQFLQQISYDSYPPVVHALVTITKKLRLVLSYGSMGPGPVKLGDSLRQYVLPFVKQQMASNGSVPFLVADLAAHLTFLSLEQRSSSAGVPSESFNQLVKKFVENDGSNVMLVSRYLWTILTEKAFGTNVRERFSNLEHLIITQAWVRINLFCSNTNNEEIRELTYQILRLPTIHQLFKLSWADLEQLAITEDPFTSLIERLGRDLDAEQDPGEIRRGLGSLFQPIDEWLRNVRLHVSLPKPKDGSRPPPWNPPVEIMGQPSKEAFRRLYHCLGMLFLKCPRALFEKNTAECLLVKLVQQLILHRNLHNFETQLSVSLDEAIRSTLHLFIIGLYRLDPVKEPCIRRFFKDLVKMYVPRMTSMGGCLGGTAQRNPFVQLWSCDERDAESAGALIIQSVAEIFISAELSSSAPTLSQHHKAVKYIDSVLKEYPNNESLYRSVITYIVPQALEMSTKSSDFQDTYTIIHSVLKSPLYTERPTLWSVMDASMQQLSSKHLSLNPLLYFKLLTKLCKEYRHVVKRFLPTLRKNIEQVFQKRGVGSDQKLQSYYDQLVKAVE